MMGIGIGFGFGLETPGLVWEKGHVVYGSDRNEWRKDDDNRWMRFQEYGNRNSAYGWEIDHIVPRSLGGSDHISNLRPRNWLGNASAGGFLSGFGSNPFRR